MTNLKKIYLQKKKLLLKNSNYIIVQSYLYNYKYKFFIKNLTSNNLPFTIIKGGPLLQLINTNNDFLKRFIKNNNIQIIGLFYNNNWYSNNTTKLIKTNYNLYFLHLLKKYKKIKVS